MATPQPLYTRDNCTFCGPLRWGLTVFWRTPVSDAPWFADLARALEADGLRVLGHRFQEPGVSQFSLCTLAYTAPLFIVKRVKGRLQYLLRKSLPKAFQRNYALRSFGPATRAAVEGYAALVTNLAPPRRAGWGRRWVRPISGYEPSLRPGKGAVDLMPKIRVVRRVLRSCVENICRKSLFVVERAIKSTAPKRGGGGAAPVVLVTNLQRSRPNKDADRR
jgi:hypothetical protein